MPPALFPMVDGRPAPVGTEYFGIVARDVVDSDVVLDTGPRDRTKVASYKDGRPKLIMKVPLLVPSGVSQWYVKGRVRDQLVQAMHASGHPVGAPRGGWGVHVKKIGERPIRGMHPASVYQVALFPPGQALELADRLGIRGVANDPRSLLESEAEKIFWKAYKRSTAPELAGLTPQHAVAQYRLDFALPDRSLGVEIDGFEFHNTPEVFVQDRVRHRELERLGWRIVRFAGKEACETPDRCVEEVAAAVRAFH